MYVTAVAFAFIVVNSLASSFPSAQLVFFNQTITIKFILKIFGSQQYVGLMSTFKMDWDEILWRGPG